MESAESMKHHAVCIPFPIQGHINPMMQLTKLLHSRGFHITFVNTEFNQRRLLRSKGEDFLRGLDDFQFESIPDGLPQSDKDATQDVPALCDSTSKTCLNPLIELIQRLNSTAGIPKVSLIVSDGLMSFGIKAAEILGIPEVHFWSASACGFMGFLHYPELIKRGIVPMKDENYLNNGYLDIIIDWISGMENIRLKNLPSFVRTTDSNDFILNFVAEETQNCFKAPAIIFNTFDDLEHVVLDAIASKHPSIYTIGPLPMLDQQAPENEMKSMRSSLWKEDSGCLDWLEKRNPNSVVYVNFGSITVMTDEQLKEFAWGLASSNHPFLWIIRPDAVMGDSAILPQEFIQETKDRGMVASWCPQDLVLTHPSVGVFLTHCGWNSMLEAICGGVPVICWPFVADQQTNCHYACSIWEMGMEIDKDVEREFIKELVKEMMEGAKGKKMRINALAWKKKAEETTKQGGTSYNNFDRLVKDLFRKDKKNRLFKHI